MRESVVKKECPTCRGAGLLRLPHSAENEALMCPLCEGRGWVPLKFTPFLERKPMPAVQHVVMTRGVAKTREGRYLPSRVTLLEFLAQYPSDDATVD